MYNKYMKINTKIVLTNFKKESLKNQDGSDLTLGKAISEILIASEEGGKHKMYLMGKKFFEEDVVDIDNADKELIKQATERCKIYTTMVTGQVLDILTNEKQGN